MIRAKKKATDREALRKRVNDLYLRFNLGRWEKCFSLIDPRLRMESKVDSAAYSGSLRKFKEAYGSINPWYIRISLHLDATSSKRDQRAFAYVYIVWQDEAHGFHMFRERWVKHFGRWYTRVVGLVPIRKESIQ